MEQLVKSDNSCLSHRGLSLDELCRQLGHYNINVRRDSVIGIRQLLSSHPELMPKHLHVLIPAVGRLVACDVSYINIEYIKFKLFQSVFHVFL